MMIDGKYLELILSGRKKATIRLKKPKYSEGDLAYLHSQGKIRGIVRITRIYSKKFEDLTDEDAKKDGFDSLDALKAALEEHYGNLKGKRLWIIEFELVKRLEKEESYGDPVEIAKRALEGLELSQRERKIIEAVIETGSIRKAAEKLYGDPLKRKKIRMVLRRLKQKLESRENLGERLSILMNGKRRTT